MFWLFIDQTILINTVTRCSIGTSNTKTSLSHFFFCLVCRFLRSGVIGHQPDDPAGLREQEEGLHHGGRRDDVVGVRFPQQEGVSGERQQSGRAAEASAGRRVGAAESLTDRRMLK